MGDTLRSALTDQVAGDTPMGGGSFETFDTGEKAPPKLESAIAFSAFDASYGGVDQDIPGGLMTCLSVPEESGDSGLKSAQGTPQIGK